MFKVSFGGRIGACCVVLATLGAAACSSDSTTIEIPPAQTVTIIGTGSTESKILSDIYANALRAGGFRVARRGAVADLSGGYAALKSGAADLFVTHTGELLTFLAATEPAAVSTSTTAVATTTTIPVVATTTPSETTTTTTQDSTDDTTDDTAGGSSSTTSVDESTTTTVSTAGVASAVSLNLQSNLIGEILPENLQLGAPSNAEDKPVIACKVSVSTGVSLLSDLARVSADLRIAAPADFETAEPFGLVGFAATYDGEFGQFVAVPQGEVAEAFAPAPPAEDTASTTTSETTSGSTDASTETTVAEEVETDADCGAFASSLDPTITNEMVVMDDDKNWVENNGVIPVLTATAYTAGVSQIVDQVSQALTTGDLREMIRLVDSGSDANTVAGQWLQLTGLSGS